MKIRFVLDGGRYSLYALELGDEHDYRAFRTQQMKDRRGEMATLIQRLERLAKTRGGLRVTSWTVQGSSATRSEAVEGIRMSDIVYEIVSEDEADFQSDIEWARQHPEYWSEKLKLDVADLVVVQLERLGISQAELARRMHTSPAFVTKILRGYHNWTLETLAKAGVALGIQWLMTSAPIESTARAFVRITELPGVPVAVQQRRRLVGGDWSAAPATSMEVTDGAGRSAFAA